MLSKRVRTQHTLCAYSPPAPYTDHTPSTCPAHPHHTPTMGPSAPSTYLLSAIYDLCYALCAMRYACYKQARTLKTYFSLASKFAHSWSRSTAKARSVSLHATAHEARPQLGDSHSGDSAAQRGAYWNSYPLSTPGYITLGGAHGFQALPPASGLRKSWSLMDRRDELGDRLEAGG